MIIKKRQLKYVGILSKIINSLKIVKLLKIIVQIIVETN